MNIETMSVNTEDRTIAINGEAYICTPENFPAIDTNISSLHWHPNKMGKCKGSVSRHVGGGEGLMEFDLLQPFVDAWWKARETKLTNNALVQAEAQGVFDPPREEIVEEEDVADLPRILRVPAQSATSQEMLAREAEFTQRATEVVEAARQSIEASRSDDSRIAALEQQVTKIQDILVNLAERWGKQ